MPIKGMILKKAGTNAVTGGTDVTYSSDGTPVVNGTSVINAANTDYRTRESIVVRNRKPTYEAKTKSFTKDKKTVTFQQPKILADGSVVANLIRIEREVHPESTAAEAAELNCQGAQLLFDSDMASFWSVGSVD